MRTLAGTIAASVLVFAASFAHAAGTDHHVNAPLVPAAGSSVFGAVHLTALPHGGTEISLVAHGLIPGEAYISLYYDNDACELEPYSEDDVVANYLGRPGGVGIASSKVADDLDEIYSVSVRRASDFTLLGCAKVRSEEAASAARFGR